MVDPEVEERIENVKELIKIWMRFYRVLSVAFMPTGITPEDEREFQDIKIHVAERHENFMKAITKDFHIGQSILSIIKRTISLKNFSGLSAIEIHKLGCEWHDANILLNETLGALESRRDELALITAQDIRKQQAKRRVEQFKKKILKSEGFRKVVKITVLVVVGGGLYRNWGRIQQTQYYQNVVRFLQEMGVNVGEEPPPPAPTNYKEVMQQMKEALLAAEEALTVRKLEDLKAQVTRMEELATKMPGFRDTAEAVGRNPAVFDRLHRQFMESVAGIRDADLTQASSLFGSNVKGTCFECHQALRAGPRSEDQL